MARKKSPTTDVLPDVILNPELEATQLNFPKPFLLLKWLL